jgi:phosphoribosylglycinamide formyltransferase 1
VHFVRPEIDAGPIIAQAVVPIHPGDDEARLASRILAVEHRLYPLAVRLIAEGRVRVAADIVEIDRWQAPTITVLNPVGPPAKPLAASLG